MLQIPQESHTTSAGTEQRSPIIYHQTLAKMQPDEQDLMRRRACEPHCSSHSMVFWERLAAPLSRSSLTSGLSMSTSSRRIPLLLMMSSMLSPERTG